MSNDCKNEKRVELFGVEIDAVRMDQAVDRLLEWVDHGEGKCRFVVTPNVDHAVMLQEHEGLQQAYREADMVLADGWPVVLASRLLRQPLPERVPGSDLVPKLFAASQGRDRPLRVFLLGAAEGVADRAAENIHSRWSSVRVVGTYSPPLGFENDETENDKILALIAEAKPDVLVVGLGAPKQELWVQRFHHCLDVSAALCVGATIDFLAGQKKRAPRWLQVLGLEWLHRMLSEPRRLAKRYARDAWVFPQLVWRQWRAASSASA